jgi:hypothetical protein
MQQQFNVQNDKVWSVSLHDVPQEKLIIFHHTKMRQQSWFGVSFPKNRASRTDFFDREVKINGKYYKTVVLEKHLHIQHPRIVLFPARRSSITHSRQRPTVVRRVTSQSFNL